MSGDRTLKVVILGDSKGAEKAFNSVNSHAEKSGGVFGHIGGIVGSFGKASVLALGGIGLAAGAAAGGAAVFGVKTAASMEQARISFTTMLGSATKADAFLKQLAAFAAKTPFEFPELQTAASSLISAGFEASKVIPIMTTLGDVTSGMGTGSDGVKRATIALQQMSAAGKITGEDLNQLRDAGVPVFDLLSAATGKTKEQISALAQKGKLGKVEMQALFDALGTGKGLERFNGLMEKQSQSLTGLLSTAKDTFGMGLAQAVAPAIPMLKVALGGAISGLTGTMGAVSDAGAQFFGGLSGKVKVMDQADRPKLELFGLGVRGMVAAMKDGDVTSDGFVGGMERIGASLRTVAQWVTGTAIPAIRKLVTEALPIIKQVADSLGGALANVLSIVTALWGQFGGIITTVVVGALTGLLAAVIGVSKALEVGTGFIKDHKQAIEVVAAIIATVLIPHWVALGIAATVSSAKQVVAWVSTQVGAAKAAVIHSAEVVKMVASWVAQGVAAMVNAAKVVAGWVMTSAGAVAAGVVMVAQSAIVVAKWVLMGTQSLLQAARVAAAWLIAMGPIGLVIAAVVGLVAVVVKNWDAIYGAIKRAANNVLDFLRKNWPLILAILTGPIGLAVLAIVKHWDGIKKAFTDGIAAVKGFFSDAGSWLVDAGKNIIAGLVKGITAMTMAPVNAVKDVAKGIAGAVTGHFKIFSPSRLMAEHGANIVQGLANGINDTKAVAVNAAKGMSAEVAKHAAAAVAAAKAHVAEMNKAAKTSAENIINDLITSLNAQKTRVHDTLSGLKAEMAQMVADRQAFADSLRSGITGAMDLGALYNEMVTAQANAASVLDAAQKTVGTSAQALADLQAKLADSTEITTADTQALSAAQLALTGAQADAAAAQVAFSAAQANATNPIASLTLSLQTQLEKTRVFGDQLRALTAEGASKELVASLAQAGQDSGGALAAGLLSQGPNAVKQISDLMAQISAAGKTAADAIAATYYQEGINHVQSLINGMAAKEKALQAQVDKIKAILRSLAQAQADVDTAAAALAKSKAAAAAPVAKAAPKPVTKAAAPVIKGARAAGGPVDSLVPYLVGEKGPELFVPNRNGTVIPNKNVPGGSGDTITIESGAVSVSVTGSDANAQDIGDAVKQALGQVVREIQAGRR